MGKPTTKDLAKAAGVSLATIDRVLNARLGVRQSTVERVQKAIKEIGFVRDMAAANLARSKEYRLVFLLPDHDDEFIDLVQGAIAEANMSMAHERTNVSIIRAPSNNPHQIAFVLDNLSAEDVDGVAIMAPETPQVRDSIARLDARGITVVAFVSHQLTAQTPCYVGINNEAAGRTVGQLMGRFTGERHGSILVLTESMQSRDSQERRLGFDSIMAKYAPRLRVCASMENYGDPVRAAKIVKAALSAQQDVVGIYLMNHDIRETMQTIIAQGTPKETIIIGHELTPQTRAQLVEGTMDAVITQDVGHMVRSSIRLLRAKAAGVETLASQERIRVEIILRENMPEES
ncbi:MAG TPA: LacI family transcriptional regulator [Rhodobacteraceae bacterium]|jgi:LacI family transcriptional regulator|nr:LacI family transcriptional regulator [Paracoccaceae bacterium]